MGSNDSGASGQIRVLVADDNLDVCRVLRELIDREPDLVCVGAVGEAEEVLHLAETERPNVVLLDLELGGTSGVDILTRGRATLPGLVFIIFSGHNQPELQRRLRQLGAADVLDKPGDLAQLTSRIRAAVSV